jgi:hypothetical protein
VAAEVVVVIILVVGAGVDVLWTNSAAFLHPFP